MSETDGTGKFCGARSRLQAFWAGDREQPFVMDRLEHDCDCNVLLATFRERMTLIARYIILSVSKMMPSSGLKVFVLRITGMKIGKDVTVSPGVEMDPLWPNLIEVGDHVVLGMGCRVLTHECTVKQFRIGRVKIGNESVIGAGATLRAGVVIGKRVTVGCNSFVNCDVADDETVGGVPARPLKAKGGEA